MNITTPPGRGVSRKKSGDFARPILIHVCKDGTVTFRRRNEPVFNGIALPVYSVETIEDARAIQAHFCRAQWHEHPLMPGRIWYRLARLGDGTDLAHRPGGLLKLEDLVGVTEMFREFSKTRF